MAQRACERVKCRLTGLGCTGTRAVKEAIEIRESRRSRRGGQVHKGLLLGWVDWGRGPAVRPPSVRSRMDRHQQKCPALALWSSGRPDRINDSNTFRHSFSRSGRRKSGSVVALPSGALFGSVLGLFGLVASSTRACRFSRWIPLKWSATRGYFPPPLWAIGFIRCGPLIGHFSPFLLFPF
jgi:hypothetical protein